MVKGKRPGRRALKKVPGVPQNLYEKRRQLQQLISAHYLEKPHTLISKIPGWGSKRASPVRILDDEAGFDIFLQRIKPRQKGGNSRYYMRVGKERAVGLTKEEYNELRRRLSNTIVTN